MTPSRQLLFQLLHRHHDDWGHPEGNEQVDRDLAREVMGLFGQVDVHVEEMLALAFARHRGHQPHALEKAP